jgi:hypothetical protein
MTKPKQTWREKWLAKEEGYSSGEEARRLPRPEGKMTWNRVIGTRSRVTTTQSRENNRQGEEPIPMDINMVFTISVEFRVPMEDVTKLALGAEHAVFEKLENLGAHMKPLFIWRHLDGTCIGHMLIDGGASINILPLLLFKKLSHIEGDLKRTNLSLSGFACDPTEAKGIICKEVMVGSKTVPMAFFVVDMKGRYNMLLTQDWIHNNECVMSTLHQCLIQWIGDEVDVVQADEEVCVAVAESMFTS